MPKLTTPIVCSDHRCFRFCVLPASCANLVLCPLSLVPTTSLLLSSSTLFLLVFAFPFTHRHISNLPCLPMFWYPKLPCPLMFLAPPVTFMGARFCSPPSHPAAFRLLCAACSMHLSLFWGLWVVSACSLEHRWCSCPTGSIPPAPLNPAFFIHIRQLGFIIGRFFPGFRLQIGPLLSSATCVEHLASACRSLFWFVNSSTGTPDDG